MGIIEISLGEYLSHLINNFSFIHLFALPTYLFSYSVSSLAAFVCLLSFSDKIVSFIYKFTKTVILVC